jgi:transcriptional regulator with XRE-family HTH domain
MRLTEARRTRLLSIRALAERAGLATRTINEIELGRTTPSLLTIKKISEVLEIDPLEIDEFRKAIRGNSMAPANV